jgi:hypothetical protein
VLLTSIQGIPVTIDRLKLAAPCIESILKP